MTIDIFQFLFCDSIENLIIMDTQKTLDSFIKSRKRPTNEDGLHKKELLKNKPTRKLSFDCAVQQTVKKQKVSQQLVLNYITIKLIFCIMILYFNGNYNTVSSTYCDK